MCLQVGLVRVLITLEARGLHNVFQHIAHIAVHLFDVQATRLYIFYDFLGLSRIAGHHQVVACLYFLTYGQVGSSANPVSHHDTVESPFVAQNRCQQVFMSLCICAVYLVIGRHYGPRVALTNGHLKAFQVKFTQCTLTYSLVHFCTSRLL